jgi:hypothetical protein
VSERYSLGENAVDEFLEIIEDRIVFIKNVTLSMRTTNERAIRNDCRCYLMEQIHIT